MLCVNKIQQSWRQVLGSGKGREVGGPDGAEKGGHLGSDAKPSGEGASHRRVWLPQVFKLITALVCCTQRPLW